MLNLTQVLAETLLPRSPGLDMGATVIMIENPKGGMIYRHGPSSMTTLP